jgi:hypothetical protein
MSPAAIRLEWDGRGDAVMPSQAADGAWRRAARDEIRRYRGLVAFDHYGDPTDDLRVIAIGGQQLEAMRLLERTAPAYFGLVYLDLPRTVLDTAGDEFRADDPISDRVWLDLVEALLKSARRLARSDGVISLLVGDHDSGSARVLADELLGRGNRIGEVAWQKTYSPQNMRGMKTLTATYDTILLYAVSPEHLRPVGRRSLGRAKASNPDGDPRGPWIAEHKGAPSRRESTDFDTYAPPYRWELASGALPPGAWRISPRTGVIWGQELSEAGQFTFVARVLDAEDGEAEKELQIDVVDDGAEPQPDLPEGIMKPIVSEDHPLRVDTDSLPVGVVGKPYYAVLKASGGVPAQPVVLRPRPPRYWEYAIDTFRDALCRDDVDFGSRGPVVPRIKDHPPMDQESVTNQTTWWPGRGNEDASGYSQDARQHLQALEAAGIVSAVPNAAKPEALMARLIDLFAPPGSAVLECLPAAGDLSAVALKRGHLAVCLTGASDSSRQYTGECLLPRLKAVIDGKDRELTRANGRALSTELYVPYDGGGRMIACELSEPVAELDPSEGVFRLSMRGDDLADAVLAALGFLPDPQRLGWSLDLDGETLGKCLSPREFLTPELAVALADEAGELPVLIAYFKSEGLEASLLQSSDVPFEAVRVPYGFPK